MKAYKIFRWLLKASALTTVMFVMQACYGSPMGMEEMRRVTDEKAEADTLPSEDLQFFGLDNEDSQSADDPIVP
jgi:hypothetical protein